MSTRLLGFAAVVSFSLAGCSEAARPQVTCTGLPDPTAAGPGDTEAWFPLAAGRRWLYRLEGQGAPAPADLRLDVGTSLSLRGFEAMELHGVDPATGADLYDADVCASSAAGLVHLASATSIAAPDRYDLRFPVVTGQSWSSECLGMDYGQDVDYDGRNESVDVRMDGQVLGFEDVTVVSGAYAGAARVRLEATLTLHPSSRRYGPVTARAWQDSWYARGFGVVRRATGDEGMPASETYELVGWSSPGGGGGLSALERLLGPPNPNAIAWPPPWQVVPQRGGAQRALVFHFTWDGMAYGVVGHLVADGAVSAPFDVVTQWIGNSPGLLMPGTFVYQVAPGPDRHLVSFVPGIEVRAARVTAAGLPEDLPSGLLVGKCEAGVATVAASRVGADFLVVWPCALDLWSARVGGDGTVGAPVLLSSEGVQFVAAGGDGASHLLAWARPVATGTELRGLRVAPDGTPLGDSVLLAAGAGAWSLVDLACGANGCLLAWKEGADGRNGIYATRVLSGTSLDLAGVRVAGGDVVGWNPLVVPTDSGFAFAWTDDDGVKLLRLSPELAPTPIGGLAILPHQLYGLEYPLGMTVLLSATDADAWLAYVWGLDLFAARWIW